MSLPRSEVEVYGPTELAIPTSPVRDLIAEWLMSKRSPHTIDAYRRDINGWIDWLTGLGVDPLEARLKHANAWARWLELTPGRSGRPASKQTINRRLAAVASFYDYLVRAELLDVNRVKLTTRHYVDKQHSPTFRPSAEETLRIFDEAQADGVRTWALTAMLTFSGARVSEVLGAQTHDFTTDMGERVFRVTRKGGAVDELPLNPPELVGGAVDAYLAQRASHARVRVVDLAGPVFLDRVGRPMTRQAAANIIATLGKRAGCPRLTPHSLRHTFATLGVLAGAKKDDLQVWMGHSDPKTTQRYIGRVKRYDTHPGRLIAEYLGVVVPSEGSGL